VFAAAVMAANAFTRHSGSDRWVRAIIAALTLFVGVYLVVAPNDGTLTLTILLAAWFLATGVLDLYVAVRMRGAPGAFLVGANGILALVLGVLITADLPGSAGWAIGLLVGINLMFWGIRMLFFAGLLNAAARS
jgi:uncharacterized membrane protein HdeD (DUF308 family)